MAPHSFAPLMTLFFRPYDEATLAAARPRIIGVKLYPEGVTTNSAGGVRDLGDGVDPGVGAARASNGGGLPDRL